MARRLFAFRDWQLVGWLSVLCAACLTQLLPTRAGAQIVLHAFSAGFTGPANPDFGLLPGRDGNYYGVSGEGGKYSTGCLFRVTPAGAIAVLHSFDPKTEGSPSGAMCAGPDGALYGTTAHMLNQPTSIYRLTLDGHFSYASRFQGSGVTAPYGTLTQFDGALYGLADLIGAGPASGVYRFKMGEPPVPVCTFAGYPSEEPITDLSAGPDGALYLLTERLENAHFTYFLVRVSISGAESTVCELPYTDDYPLHNYNGNEAFVGAALTLGPDGRLYGVLGAGPSVAFAVTTAGAVTTLHRFTQADEEAFASPLVAQGQRLVCTVAATTGVTGSLCAMSLSGAFTTLYQFGTNQGTPGTAPVTPLPDGSLVGEIAQGGPYNLGLLWRFAPSGGFANVAAISDGAASGWQPAGGLSLGPDGGFYTTTQYGGLANMGEVERCDHSGIVSPEMEITGKGLRPPGFPPFVASDGTAFTLIGGRIFKTAPLGVTSVFASLSPYYGLSNIIQAADGALYGVATGGSGLDTVYRVSARGIFTVVHAFSGSTGDLAGIVGGLTLGSDGAIYGVATYGGNNGTGGIFRIDTSGNYSVTVNFESNINMPPYEGLTRGADGALYGVGFDPNELVPLLYRFAGGRLTAARLEALPNVGITGPLMLATDGSLYALGTSLFGGGTGGGAANVAGASASASTPVAILRIDPAQNVSVINGSIQSIVQPQGQLVEWAGDLYAAAGPQNYNGATGHRGPITDGGAIIRLNLHLHDHDFTGNGASDILLHNDISGALGYWTMNGTHGTASGLIAGMPGLPWQVVGTCDINRDGLPDLLYYNPKTGDIQYVLLRNSHVIGAGMLATAVTSDWRPDCVADFDGTEDPYLLWQSRSTGAIVFWHLDGTKILDTGIISTALSSDEQLMGAGFLINRDRPDLLFQNIRTGTVTVRRSAAIGLSTAAVLATGVSSQWRIAGTAYISGGSQADIIWVNQTGTVAWWSLNGASIGSKGVIGTAGAGWTPVER